MNCSAAHGGVRKAVCEQNGVEFWFASDLQALLGYEAWCNLSMRYSDPDHVAVGPTGIFVIETKSNRGTVEPENVRLKTHDGDTV